MYLLHAVLFHTSCGLSAASVSELSFEPRPLLPTSFALILFVTSFLIYSFMWSIGNLQFPSLLQRLSWLLSPSLRSGLLLFYLLLRDLFLVSCGLSTSFSPKLASVSELTCRPRTSIPVLFAIILSFASRFIFCCMWSVGNLHVPTLHLCLCWLLSPGLRSQSGSLIIFLLDRI